MTLSDIDFKLHKTCSFEEKVVQDFLFVENTVFGLQLDYSYFKRKFEDNLYGPSIIVIAYLKDKPIAADALWRNDIDGKCAYQSTDTAVMSECRGRGVFKRLVEEKLSLVEDDAIVYGFPNQNSYPGFIKMGWLLTGVYYTSFYKGYKHFSSINGQKIDVDYAKWWFSGRPSYYAIKKSNHFFLVAKRNKIVYSIIGEINEDTAREFMLVKGFSILI